jgi:hypothetical protein
MSGQKASERHRKRQFNRSENFGADQGPGLGLWISHQLVDITHRRHPGGYTIRMTATRAAHNGAVVTPPARLN